MCFLRPVSTTRGACNRSQYPLESLKELYGEYQSAKEGGARSRIVTKNIHCRPAHRFIKPSVASGIFPDGRNATDRRTDRFCPRGGNERKRTRADFRCSD